MTNASSPNVCFPVRPLTQKPSIVGPPYGCSREEASADLVDDVAQGSGIVFGDPRVGKVPEHLCYTQVRVLTTPKDMSAEECALHCTMHLIFEPGV